MCKSAGHWNHEQQIGDGKGQGLEPLPAGNPKHCSCDVNRDGNRGWPIQIEDLFYKVEENSQHHQKCTAGIWENRQGCKLITLVPNRNGGNRYHQPTMGYRLIGEPAGYQERNEHRTVEN